MSNYRAPAIHPRTKKIELADYLDNHYGGYRYGVRFGDGSIWPIDKVHARRAEEEVAAILAGIPSQQDEGAKP